MRKQKLSVWVAVLVAAFLGGCQRQSGHANPQAVASGSGESGQGGVAASPCSPSKSKPPPASATVPTIAITLVPPSGPGGDQPVCPIQGKVIGVDHPEQYRVILYTMTDLWYVQPYVDHPLTSIRANGEWASSTHLGGIYAAALVRVTFSPEAQADSLPAIGGDVIDVVQEPGS